MLTKRKKDAGSLALSTRRRRLGWLLRLTVIAIVLSLLGLTVFLINSYRAYAKVVDERIARGYQTSRAGIYAAPRVLRGGQKYSPAQLAEVLRRAGYIESDTASEVWADTAYHSQANEKYLADRLLRSQIHRKKPKGKPMPRRIARANNRKSKVRAAVEHVFARQKGPMALFIRTIGIDRATTKIGLANILYNMKRVLWLTTKAALA